MIEVGFTPSIVGLIKAAAAYNGLFNGKEQETGIIQLELMLDKGFIDEDITSDYRTNFPKEFYSYEHFSEEDIEEPLDEDDCWSRRGILNQWDLFNKYLPVEKNVRIWVSETAESYCGFLWLCNYLECKNINVYILKCPDIVRGRQIIKRWEQLERKDLVNNIKNSVKLTETEISIHARRWEELIKENSLLRVLLGSEVISVNEDFYDFIIRKHLPNDEIKQKTLISNIFFSAPIPISNIWYMRRIDYLISQGEIVIVEDAYNQNERLLKKA
ncbi:protein of unknown function [Pseudobutyrivibrio sp. YE44]|uniref:DUF3658 domain-containing protein n=1 Tax=Pseudobutyrivibrio sp. YE44 TaxID=1520802 RepID=UPI000886DB7B|nr:DUF3658 domain-containing protein [Pseudobutyrivibrio sp. YE44]SDB44838.1 protein of unknown function [Pseudobutyrivibrio sp. YE44]